MSGITITLSVDGVKAWGAALEKAASLMTSDKEDLAEEIAVLRQVSNQMIDAPVISVERPQFFEEITVEDPDMHGPVALSVYKTSGGGIVAVDTSYLDQVRAMVPSPFDDHVLLDLRMDEERENEDEGLRGVHRER